MTSAYSMQPDAPTRSGRWDTVARLYAVALRRLYERSISDSSPVRDAGQAAPDPCAVRAEIRSTAGATSYAPTAGKGPAL